MPNDTAWDAALVQSRLTAAGFILALLVFVTSALMALVGLRAQVQPDKANFINQFPVIYINTLIPVCLGFFLAVAALAFLLQAQATKNHTAVFFGELLLYLALSQFLASGVNNIISGHYSVREIGDATTHPTEFLQAVRLLRCVALLLWLCLILVAPIVRVLHAPGVRVPLAVAYAIVLVIVMYVSSLGYFVRGNPPNASRFATFAYQFIQPCLWFRAGA